ncbi:hypothetical protein C8F04DRAFT_1311561, partial [Mycena alexandri]
MARQTSPSGKTKIVEWGKARKSHNWIREHLKGHNNISDRQILRIQKRYTEKENYYDVGKSTGRPHKLEPRDTRKALRHLANGSVRNATELQHDFFPEVHVKTLKRDLRSGRHYRRSGRQWMRSILLNCMTRCPGACRLCTTRTEGAPATSLFVSNCCLLRSNRR